MLIENDHECCANGYQHHHSTRFSVRMPGRPQMQRLSKKSQQERQGESERKPSGRDTEIEKQDVQLFVHAGLPGHSGKQSTRTDTDDAINPDLLAGLELLDRRLSGRAEVTIRLDPERPLNVLDLRALGTPAERNDEVGNSVRVLLPGGRYGGLGRVVAPVEIRSQLTRLRRGADELEVHRVLLGGRVRTAPLDQTLVLADEDPLNPLGIQLGDQLVVLRVPQCVEIDSQTPGVVAPRTRARDVASSVTPVVGLPGKRLALATKNSVNVTDEATENVRDISVDIQRDTRCLESNDVGGLVRRAR